MVHAMVHLPAAQPPVHADGQGGGAGGCGLLPHPAPAPDELTAPPPPPPPPGPTLVVVAELLVAWVTLALLALWVVSGFPSNRPKSSMQA